MYHVIQKGGHKVKIFRSLLCFLSILLIFGTVAPGFISANSLGVESEDLSIEILLENDEETVYKVKEDGQLFLFEEQTKGDVVTTAKYLLEGSEKN